MANRYPINFGFCRSANAVCMKTLFAVMACAALAACDKDNATDTARTIRVGNRPRGLAVAGGLVWVGAQPAATSHRGGTLTALSQVRFGSIDPTCPTGSVPCYWVTNETSDLT